MQAVKRVAVLAGAVVLVAAACGGGDGSQDPVAQPGPATTTTVAPPPPLLNDPLPARDTAIESLCAGLLISISDGDDDRTDSLVRALTAAVKESNLGTEEQRSGVAEFLAVSLRGDVNAVAVEMLAEIAGEECSQLNDGLDLVQPDYDDPEVLATRLGEARNLWDAAGFGDGDYTLDIFVENSAWFDVREESIGDQTECGLFGEWRVLVSQGEVVEARDRFTGCEIDLSNGALFWPIPTTVPDMFDFIAGNICCLQVGFDLELGVPSAVSYDLGDGSVFFGVQEVLEGYPTRPDEVLAAVAAQRALWESARPGSYTLTLRRSCFCLPPFTDPYTVTVVGGDVVSVTRDGVQMSVDALMPTTVEDLFREIEEAAFADRLDVIYDADLGYPLRIDVNPVLDAVDEEYTIEVIDLVPG